MKTIFPSMPKGEIVGIWLDGLALMSIKRFADVACDDEYGIAG